jgi:hypothetical protein
MRTISLVFACCVWAGTASAQDAAAEVKQEIEAMARTAGKGDVTTYGASLSDDLRWVNPDGTVITKAQRLEVVAKATGGGPRFENVDVKVQGNTAAALFDTIFPDGRRLRAARTYTKRDGRWVLMLHMAVQLK